MKRALPVLFLLAAFVSMTTVSWAAFEKTETVEMINDASPDLGPVATYPTVDVMWDLLFWFNAEPPTGSNLLLGGAFAGGYFWITGGGGSSGVTTDNRIYRLTPGGAAVDSFLQPNVGSGWGFRDMAFDGTYLYGGCEAATINAWDLAGAMVPSMNVTKPAALAIARSLAYDPVTDSFWSGNFGTTMFNFTRTGTVIWSGPPGTLTGVYGMAWDSVDPAGPWLWIYDQIGTPGTVFHKYNPTTHAFVGVSYTQPLFGGLTANIAGGCEMTSSWNPALWTMVAVGQGTAFDNLFVLEMYLALSGYAPAAPTGFTVANNGAALNATLNWTNPTTTINGNPLASISSVQIKRNGNPLTSLVGTPGQAMTYTDAVPSVGSYAYQVYCVNDSGNGQPASASAWIGLDTPNGPTNVQAVGGWLTATITWTAPTTGQHGGYFPPGSWTGQKIYRNGTLLTTLLGTNTQYVDNPSSMGPYIYGVAYYNTSGDGPTVNAPEIQVQGPAQYVPTSIPFNWVEINPAHPGSLHGINTGLNSDDQNLGPFPIGFDFSYYGGATFNSIRMCTNGFASFTSTSTVYVNVTIPTAAEPNNLLAVYWDDLNMNPAGSHGTAWYYYDAPNSRFIAEWDSVKHFGGYLGDYFTFEIILYTNGTIDYMYKAIVAGSVTPFPQATVGVENATGTIGALATFNGSGPLEPVSQYGIHFGPSVAPPNVTITMTPAAPPIQIPAIGGSFNFDVSLHNGESTAQTFDAWIMVQLPNGSWYGPVLGPFVLTLPGNFTLTRTRTQVVPGSAPTGNYLYEGRVGDYPGTIWDSDSFPFEKLAVGDGALVPEWANYGESFDLEQAAIVQPAVISLQGARPNPFNPTTTLSFALPEAAKVTLSVYDVSGRQVATLVNGWRDAGSHEVTFDGSALASGVYLYRLSTDQFSAVEKMVLMK